MTPDRAAWLVAHWTRFYTRALPPPIADRRVEEISADVHDHVAHERSLGAGDSRVALGILSRMARGMPDDIQWRHQVRSKTGDFMKPFVAVLAAALGIAVLALYFDSPLLVLLSVALIGLDVLGVLFLGLKTAQQGDFVKAFIVIVGAALVVAAIGVTAIVLGERGDAPGLVLLGVAVITSVVVGAFQLGVRTARRSS